MDSTKLTVNIPNTLRKLAIDLSTLGIKDVEPQRSDNAKEVQVINFDICLPKDDKRYKHKITEDFCYDGKMILINYPEPYVLNPNFNSQSNEIEIQHLLKWVEELKLPKSCSEFHENLCETVPPLSTCVMPNLEIGSLRYRVVGYWGFLINYLDDYLDDILFNNRDRKESLEAQNEKIKRLTEELTILTNMLEGVEVSDANLEDLEGKTLLDLKSLGKIIKSMNEALVGCVEGYYEKNKPFVDSFITWFNSSFWRIGRNENPRTMQISENTYLYFRRVNTAGYMLFELTYLLNNIAVPNWLTLEPDFICYRENLMNTFGISNDIYSAGKEIIDNETENLVVQKMINKKYDFYKSLDECLKYVNDEAEEAQIYAERILNRFPDNKELYEVIKSMSFIIDGHHFYSGLIKRYGNVKQWTEWISSDQL